MESISVWQGDKCQLLTEERPGWFLPFECSLNADELDSDNEVEPNRYRLDYIFGLDQQYDPDNMHLVIYVRNDETDEIYHVIKEDFD